MKKIYLLNNLSFNNIENLEVFKIKYIKKDIDFSKYDAIIFTSKNAVYSVDSFSNDWKKIPSYAIAPKTAKIIENLSGKVEYIGKSGHGNDYAKELITHLENKKTLYLRASKTVSNLISILKENKIDIDDEVIYETTCNDELEKKDFELNSIFIFTSPSSVECFFKKFDWHHSFTAIVIGNTTSKFLPKEVNFLVSTSTSVEECVKLAQKL
ncbi:uroporphyrinogen-III synthase [Malaciobacter canalis]|uniref:uroporphyrinogen-III synthase n=1 Tax=Malaciobacter canalis TaxID=1912871 RepID=UPI00384DC213